MSIIKDTLMGKQAKSNSTTPTGWETLPTQGQNALSSLWSQGKNLAANIAPYSGAENAALQNLSTQFNPNFNFGQQADAAFERVPGQIDYANSLIGSGTRPITSGEYQNSLDMFMNPFTGQVVNTAINDIRDESARQGSDIANLASTAGAFGGTRQSLLESELGRNTQRTIGDVSGQLRSQGFESSAQKALQALTDERNRYLTGAGIANQGAGLFTQLGQGNLQGKELVSNLARQSNLDTLMAGQTQREMPQQGLQLLQRLYGSTLLPLVGGGQSQTSRGETSGLLDSAAGIGGLSKAVGGIASFFSDKRLKSGIEKVGEKGGINIYEFSYIGDDKRYRGVMAQEVSHIDGAVEVGEDGYLRVNYDVVGIPFEEVS